MVSSMPGNEGSSCIGEEGEPLPPCGPDRNLIGSIAALYPSFHFGFLFVLLEWIRALLSTDREPCDLAIGDCL